LNFFSGSQSRDKAIATSKKEYKGERYFWQIRSSDELLGVNQRSRDKPKSETRKKGAE